MDSPKADKVILFLSCFIVLLLLALGAFGYVFYTTVREMNIGKKFEEVNSQIVSIQTNINTMQTIVTSINVDVNKVKDDYNEFYRFTKDSFSSLTVRYDKSMSKLKDDIVKAGTFVPVNPPKPAVQVGALGGAK